MKIGNIYLEHGLGLAPMAGVTDRWFRRLCASFGAEYAVTEMVSAKALCYEKLSRRSVPAKSACLAYIENGSIPTAVQLFGSEPSFMAEAARMIAEGDYREAEGAGVAAIDINMGCPVKKVVSCGEGSALMKTPELAGRIVSAVRAAVSIPVTVKIRAGWSRDTVNAPELARRLEAAGADAVCVHGRTRDQFYAPSSDNRVIADVKKALSIPVFGNGDIYTAKDATRMLEETGCDGIMVARGTLGNPWLFAEIRAALDKTQFIPPDSHERIALALKYIREATEEKGSQGIIEARGQLSWYVRGIPGAAAARAKLNTASDIDEMTEILNELEDNAYNVTEVNNRE